MSNEKNSPVDTGQPAVDYVNQQLDEARSSLGRTKMVAIIVILLVLAYMTYVTKSILGHLEPTQAAETAKGLLVTQLASQGEAVADTLKEKIPQLMHDLPEAVLNRMPTIRENIEIRIEAQLQNYARLTAAGLEPQLEEFLTKHQADIQSFLDASQDLDALREDLNADFDNLLNGYLASSTDGQESLLEKLEQSKLLLNRIADQTERLAMNKDLSEREKQSRRAIAVLLAKADFKLYDATRDGVDPEDEDADEAK
ncbi:MAG TPA: hypothetical protein DCY13_18775 [Verrucomicrobiales bacterium]|nr:hypothetical protein [Verrucomicrobiales bacterium]